MEKKKHTFLVPIRIMTKAINTSIEKYLVLEIYYLWNFSLVSKEKMLLTYEHYAETN